MTMSIFPATLTSLQKLILTYLLILLFGGMVLQLPFLGERSAEALDHFFTATSALSTTGLTTVNVRDTYTFGGELVVLFLLQLGGIGYMSLAGTFLLDSDYGVKRQEEEDEMVEADYTIPDRTNLRTFVQHILVYTVSCEVIGGIVLAYHFSASGVSEPIWRGFFTAISAFCTAGLHLFDTSLHSFAEDVVVNVTVSVLSLAGSFGFLLFSDVTQRLRGRKQRLSLSTKIICLVMAASVTVLSLALYPDMVELNESMEVGTAAMVAVFTAVSTVSTTGFSTVSIAELGIISKLLIVLFMFVGASPSGTGGGVKNTTLATVIAFVVAVIRRRDGVRLLGVRLSDFRTRLAIGLFIAYLGVVVVASILLLLDDQSLAGKGIFEVYSALGTVGLSLGATGQLPVFSTCLIMVLMMTGRLGVLSVLMATVGKSPQSEETTEADDEPAGEDIDIEG